MEGNKGIHCAEELGVTIDCGLERGYCEFARSRHSVIVRINEYNKSVKGGMIKHK